MWIGNHIRPPLPVSCYSRIPFPGSSLGQIFLATPWDFSLQHFPMHGFNVLDNIMEYPFWDLHPYENCETFSWRGEGRVANQAKWDGVLVWWYDDRRMEQGRCFGEFFFFPSDKGLWWNGIPCGWLKQKGGGPEGTKHVIQNLPL